MDNESVCQGIMKDYFDAFVDNFFARYLTSQHVCVFLNACQSHDVPVDFESWKEAILATKPSVNKDNNKNNSTSNNQTFKVLHLTDLHTDLEYEVGSLADCDEPFCCRPESGEAPADASSPAAAQYWGTFAKCDLPLHTVDALLAESKTKHGDIDMIIWTGDNTSHDIWH